MAVLLIALLVVVGTGWCQTRKRLPAGLSHSGAEYPASECEFLRDLTWVDATGRRHTNQQVFAAVLAMIQEARSLILMDMFLYNDFASPSQDLLRPLAQEVTAALIARKTELPGLRVILITDPVNTVYGSIANPWLERLRAAGITVIITDLDRLRDSNVFYSPLWRLLVRPLGSGGGMLFPNPLGSGRVSVRSVLRLLNFKANHRKLLVTDQGEGYAALVTSANPHGCSSAHGNVALKFSGPAAGELLTCERSVPGVLPGTLPDVSFLAPQHYPESPVTIQVLTESGIKQAVLTQLAATGDGDRVDLVMFYLADCRVIRALIQARQRGARLRVILDPNKDAFGRIKNGIPNRQTAADLVAAGVPVRWGNTHGEQLHSKMLLIERKDGPGWLLLGSANFTRRNLDDYNLELDVALRAYCSDPRIAEARRYVDQLWENEGHEQYSLGFTAYADRNPIRKIFYRWQETTGMGTF